ncbi:DUF1811 family protein [Alicyclobacillus cycloheptanicus]|uniref:Uncharacterized protein n=1 Tax=Alicyclobacillus cycloheptanicus TaxID=1457 RepID=A0ABT9XL86_9BACL|nr:DUF1811 family protein [Alicyclobacillus cycloheptanicus]MDQ0190880.1 hypothetical protein [Alicyclobacillus cycloheptanicus]
MTSLNEENQPMQPSSENQPMQPSSESPADLRYSDMTETQLQHEMDKLREQGQRAYDQQNWSEYNVLMTKWYLAKSYLIFPTVQVEIGKMYDLTEEYDRLTVTKLEGVMAWGIRESDASETAVPIAMLKLTE